ncbi:MAG: ATP phosphoribosyltransferase [Planctomycetota bacterium]|jgi:ATP phosphoribosyltransferase
MPIRDPQTSLRLALPKGRMQDGVLRLLSDAGLPIRVDERSYRPRAALDGIDAKLLKPQNILHMLGAGLRDLGFAGRDWVDELGVDVEEVLDTQLNPVQIVAAASPSLLIDGELPTDRPLVVASEYQKLTQDWVARRGLQATFVRSYGATEAFPPDDADVIVDNTATGSTLRAHGLTIVEELMRSSTRLYASRQALSDPARAAAIEDFALLVRSALDARTRVMLELNCPAEALEPLVAALPCMRTPTVSPLHGELGFAVKAAVPRQDLARLVPTLKALGATDLVVTEISQLVA